MFKTGQNPMPREVSPACRTEVGAADIGRAKEAYRTKARQLSWEEKVASIERMREASKLAKASTRIRFGAP